MYIGIPEVVEIYYQEFSQIDGHNRCRQDESGLGNKLEVNKWSLRVNTALLSKCILDAWPLRKGRRGSRCVMSHSYFYARY